MHFYNLKTVTSPGADLEIFREGFLVLWNCNFSLAVRVEDQKKGHYIVLNAVKVISKAKV